MPEPRTPLSGIRKLPGGHLLVEEVDPWLVTEHTYWCMNDIHPLGGDPVKLIRQQLDEISVLVVGSDMPVGVALSSGVDSGALAALAVRTIQGYCRLFQ